MINVTMQQTNPCLDNLPVTHVRNLLISGTNSRALNSIIFRDILKHTESVPSVEKISTTSIETEPDHIQDDVSLSNSTQKKITEEDNNNNNNNNPVDSHKNKSEEDGFAIIEITQEKQSKITEKISPKVQAKKKTTLEVD
ncbi:hypothetical protein Hanom_Chr13g01219981 [Helianthus anomalus]